MLVLVEAERCEARFKEHVNAPLRAQEVRRKDHDVRAQKADRTEVRNPVVILAGAVMISISVAA